MIGGKIPEFDVAIVGGGFGGAALACILARHGIRVLLMEGGGHPRFAIGESTTPDTTMGLRVLGTRYDVQEIVHLSSHSATRQHISSSCGVKRNFTFVYHHEGESVQPAECTQYLTLGPPLGPDTHLLRQDVDAYLFQAALSYGATGRTYTSVDSAEFDSEGVTLHTTSSGDYRAKYLVDAGGMKSLLASQLELRLDPPPYQTRSRSIFSHFVGVEPFDRIAPPQREHKLLSPLSQGTLHHLFKGGWAWVIPFDNHIHSTTGLCSVGINLDIDRYPRLDNESAEQEFWAHVNRFPDFRRQMSSAVAVRPFAASERSQFASRQVIGDRWCLLPHASDFIDPLFSTGLSATVMVLNALGHRLIDAVRDDDFSRERFEYVETWTKKVFEQIDEVVSCSYVAFDEFELINAWLRIWMLMLIYSGTNQMQSYYAFKSSNDPASWERLEQAPHRGVQSLDNPACMAMFRVARQAMRDYRDKIIQSDEACRRIYGALDDSGLCPPSMNLTDPTDRCPSRALTVVPLFRLLFWARSPHSPAEVRGLFQGRWTGETIRLARRYFVDELVRGGVGIRRAGRDLFFSGNHDWEKDGAS